MLYARIRNLLKYKEGVVRDFKHQLVFELKDLNYTSLDEDFLQRAIDCVNGHLEDAEFDQPQFADEMKTSKSTLYKKLKSLTGLNTSAFIRNVRLKSACRIMEEKVVISVSPNWLMRWDSMIPNISVPALRKSSECYLLSILNASWLFLPSKREESSYSQVELSFNLVE